MNPVVAKTTRSRQELLMAAVRIEVVALVWIAVEASFGTFAAFTSGALSTSIFSVDSGIELISGIVVLVRLMLETSAQGELPKWVEPTAGAIVGFCLLSLAAWIAFCTGQAAAIRQAPLFSNIALSIALLSSFITPWLALRKRRLGKQLGSVALQGDAACTMTCALMAWTLLIGLLLQWTGVGWWVDPLAAVAILVFVIREGFESVAPVFGGSHEHHRHA